MARAIFCIILLLNMSVGNNLYAKLKGKALIDSLEKELNSDAYRSKEDSAKVYLLLKLAFTYRVANPDEAIKYCLQAGTLAKRLSLQKALAKAYYLVSDCYHSKSDFPKSLEYGFKSLKIYEPLNDSAGIASALRTIGLVYFSSKHMPEAMEYYLKELKIREALGDTIGTIPVLGNIGITYWHLGDWEQSLEYQLKTLALAEKYKFDMMIANSLANLAQIYAGKTDPDISKALRYYFRSLQYVGADSFTRATLLGNIGATYIESVTYDSLNQIKPDDLIPASKTERFELAVQYLEQAIAIEERIGDIEGVQYFNEVLSKVYVLMGNYKDAYRTYQKNIVLRDSIFNMANEKSIMQQQMQYDYEKKEAAAKAEQEKKDIIQKNIRNSTIGGMAIMLVFSTVVMRQRNKVKKQKARSEDLLLNILPAEVAEELKEKGSAEAKLIDEATVLFTDFKGFTQLSETLSPHDLVAEINSCFSAFDLIMQKHGIEKIKTIGDAYMAAGGLPTPNTTHAMDVVKAAKEIQQFMQSHKEEREAAGQLFLEIRIGVHTGPVVAGIVGIKKFAYDIWGDTVNTASRMESSGSEGKVNISGTTYELVKDAYNCEYRGEISAKNKGMLKMYFVNEEV
jgi:adenylate cyclase